MPIKELDLKEYLNKYQGSCVDFFRFPGNYGDSLIWHGTKRLLASLNITEHLVDIPSHKHNDTLFIDGGGNFVDYYSDVRDFLAHKLDVYREIVMLPHTIFGEKQVQVLNNVSGKVTIFCRERVSAQFLEGKIARGEVYLWHDCAFYNVLPQGPQGKGVLNTFRSDKESVFSTPPGREGDISYNGYATKPLDELIDALRKYKQINTDRLHIAIGATLLGKQVTLFPNSYYKNKAVFDYSLKRFPNIRFVENFETSVC